MDTRAVFGQHALGNGPPRRTRDGHLLEHGVGALRQARRAAALGDTGRNHIKAFPNVPTMRELGYDFINDTIYLIAAPKGTPKP